MQHDRVYHRYKSYLHMVKKQNIVKYVYGMLFSGNSKYEGHKLSKGKVHCSCPMCSMKTVRDGWKHADRVALEKGCDDTYFNELSV